MTIQSALLAASVLLTSFCTSADDTCIFSDGRPAAQPTQPKGAPTFTCASIDNAAVGHGRLSIGGGSADGAYLDAQVFSYARTRSSGRGRVKVALLPLGADGGCGRGAPDPPGWPGIPTSAEEGMRRILSYLNRAGEEGADLAVLPENAFGRRGMPPACAREPETIDGPVATAVRSLARRHRMHVVLPLHEARGGRVYNTAVVIDRAGGVVGNYSKVFPVFGDAAQTVPPTRPAEVGPPAHVVPSAQGVAVFTLDFGRLAVLICYDVNFAELWQQAAALGADLVAWPAAMATPDPTVGGYARAFRYDILGVGFPGQLLDRTGADVAPEAYNASSWPMLKLATVDVDRTFVHWDYNRPRVAALLAAHPEVVVDVPGPPFYLLRSTAANVSVRALLAEHGIETAGEYITRSREGLNRLRNYGA
jgi:hypothetical protein